MLSPPTQERHPIVASCGQVAGANCDTGHTNTQWGTFPRRGMGWEDSIWGKLPESGYGLGEIIATHETGEEAPLLPLRWRVGITQSKYICEPGVFWRCIGE